MFCLPTFFSFLSEPVEHGSFSAEEASSFGGTGIKRLPLLVQTLNVSLARTGALFHAFPYFHRVLEQLPPLGVFLLDAL